MPAYNDSRTREGVRPDLAELEVNSPQGYIANMLIPVDRRGKKSGTLYYQEVVADSAAETDRTVGTAPTRVILANTSTTYTAAELIKGYYMPWEEVGSYDNIAIADKVGGKAAKRSVMRAQEDAAVTLTLARGAADADVGTDFLGAIATAKAAVKRYAGKLVFVCSESVFRTIMESQTIQNRMANFTSVRPVDNQAALSLDKVLLAIILGVEDVVIGDDAHWAKATAGASSNIDVSDRAAILKIAPPEEASEKLDPVWAKCIQYWPEDATTPYEINSFPDNDERSNKYDAIVWQDPTVYNADGCYVLEGIDATMDAAAISGTGDVTLPAAASTAANGESIDLGASPLLSAIMATLTLPALDSTALPDTKTVTYQIEESADDVTFSDLTGYTAVAVQTGASSSGAAAASVNIGLPLTVKRYVRLVATTGSGTGDCSGSAATLSVRQ